jgi:hypothetical protein
VKPTPEGGNQKIKLKVRINPSGVFNVSSAAMIEKVEIEEEVPVQMEVRVPHGFFFVSVADPGYLSVPWILIFPSRIPGSRRRSPF